MPRCPALPRSTTKPPPLTRLVGQNNASNADRLVLVSECYKLYTKKYPELIGKRASGKSRWKNREAKVDKAKLAASTEPKAKPRRDSECKSEGSERTQTFLERACTLTGKSKQVIARDLDIIKGFTEEQLKALGRVDCAQTDVLRILKLTKGDTDKKQKIVSRVAKGMDLKEAIRIVCVPAPSGVKADSDAHDAWFEKECGKFGESLGNTDYYKSDAIVYRDILEARTEFRKKLKKIAEKHKQEWKNLRVGWLLRLLHTLINLSHPKDWIKCPTCGGRGIMVDSGAECPKCNGYCYNLKAETAPKTPKHEIECSP